jgi:hypothetical protein
MTSTVIDAAGLRLLVAALIERGYCVVGPTYPTGPRHTRRACRPGPARRVDGAEVEAACRFTRNTGYDAVIGSLADIAKIVAGAAGTRVSAR